MKNTKAWQRVLSMAVCLCMIVGLVPAMASTASAVDEGYSASLITFVVKNASTNIDSYVDGEVENLMFLTPYTQYKLKLTSADKNTVYYSDSGKSTDGGNTYSNGSTYTNSNNTSIDQYQFGAITFKEETYSIGYISKRGYFVATSEGTADITITALENGVEVASSTLTVRVVAKEKYQYNFRRVMKYIISGAPSGWRSANIPWTAMTNYAYTTVGDNMETVPEDKYYPRSDTTANYNTYWGGSYDYLAFAPRGGTKYPNQQTAPWKYAGSSSAVGEAVPSYANGYYGQKNAHIGEWVQFKIKVPSKGKYDITHYGSSWDEREAVTINGTAYSASANQQIYLAPASVGEGSAAFADTYLLGTDDRYTAAKNGSGKNWNITNTLARDHALEAGEYIVTFKKPATETTTALNIGVLSFVRSDSPIVAAEIEAAKASYEIDEEITFNVSGTMIDGSEATLTNATYAYEVVSGNAVKIDNAGKPIASAVGTATVKVSVTLNGVTVSDTVDVTVTDDVLAYSYTYQFNDFTSYVNDADEDVRISTTNYIEQNLTRKNGDFRIVHNEKGSSINIRNTSGCFGYNAGSGNWVTIRINVKRPGWYDADFTVGKSRYGARLRAFVTDGETFTNIMNGIPTDTENKYHDYDYTSFSQLMEQYSIGTINCYASADDYAGNYIQPVRKIHFAKAGEYAITLQAIEMYGTGGSAYQMFVKSLKIDRVAFADATAATVFGGSNVDVSLAQPEGGVTVAKENTKSLALLPEDESTVHEDFVGASNITVTSSDSNIATATVSKSALTNINKLTINGIEAGTANITVSAVRDGVTYSEVIPVSVTHDVANFGNAYAYIQEEFDGDKTTYKVAMISGLDFEEGKYKTVGFEYKIGERDGSIDGIQSVYQSIQVGESGASLSADDLGAVNYLFYGIAENISPDFANESFKFRAYAVDQHDNKICGGWLTLDTVVKPAAQ